MDFLKQNRKVIICCLIIALAAYLISTYFIQLMVVHGDSMYPSLKNMQFALIDKRAENFKAGDVIVFRCGGLKSMLVKRVVGCPGDSVVIRGGKLYVNGEESTLYEETTIEYEGLLGKETVLGDGEYAVLGDNLAHSRDSRYKEVGIVEKEDINGKVIL